MVIKASFGCRLLPLPEPRLPGGADAGPERPARGFVNPLVRLSTVAHRLRQGARWLQPAEVNTPQSSLQVTDMTSNRWPQKPVSPRTEQIAFVW